MIQIEKQHADKLGKEQYDNDSFSKQEASGLIAGQSNTFASQNCQRGLFPDNKQSSSFNITNTTLDCDQNSTQLNLNQKNESMKKKFLPPKRLTPMESYPQPNHDVKKNNYMQGDRRFENYNEKCVDNNNDYHKVKCYQCDSLFEWDQVVDLICKHTFCLQCSAQFPEIKVVQQKQKIITQKCPRNECSYHYQKEKKKEYISENGRKTIKIESQVKINQYSTEYKAKSLDNKKTADVQIEINDQTKETTILGLTNCPECRGEVEKFENNTQTTCKKCQYEFCWNCGLKFHHFLHAEWMCFISCKKIVISQPNNFNNWTIIFAAICCYWTGSSLFYLALPILQNGFMESKVETWLLYTGKRGN
ncbi:ibr domain containing protein [Stylonychia lemnae]|uniref:Ibr domain containing protein n=1 Tax=Stylonychia lemnae TaxID=5949 RepID=A0A078AFV9_STYLE|nr:ibr domain containing protein [Stylonychia lemnae]|eukprot:CDW81165.1 ibr domain containing protein [Stylonychia lemnae]